MKEFERVFSCQREIGDSRERRNYLKRRRKYLKMDHFMDAWEQKIPVKENQGSLPKFKQGFIKQKVYFFSRDECLKLFHSQRGFFWGWI